MIKRIEIDARGLMCPEPVRLVARAIPDLAPGTRLSVLATDLAAPVDFESWCRSNHCNYLGSEEADNHLVIEFELTGVSKY